MQWTGFRPLYRTDGGPIQHLEWIISNSMTLEEGDAVKIVAGAGIEPADAVDDTIAGYVVGFQTPKGLPLRNAVSGTDYNGTFTAARDGDTYVSRSSNLTTDKIMAIIAVADSLVVSAKVDATLGTTTGSNLVSYHLSILTTDSTQLDENTATTTLEQFLLMPSTPGSRSCVDPQDTSRVYAMVQEPQLVGAGTEEGT